jgi:hypothetical protein
MNEHMLGYRKPAPEEQDPRRLRYSAGNLMDQLGVPKTPKPTVWQVGPKILDQGNTGRCTTFGMNASRAASPLRLPFLDEAEMNARYLWATLHDPWPDNDHGGQGDITFQFGTSVHAILEAYRQAGDVKAFLWMDDRATMERWLDHMGPVVVGTTWYNSMFRPINAKGDIRIDPSSGGADQGHCYCFLGRTGPSGYRQLNSWGIGWGWRGRSWMDPQTWWRYLGSDDAEIVGFVDMPSSEVSALLA